MKQEVKVTTTRRYFHYFRSQLWTFLLVFFALVGATYFDSLLPRIYRDLSTSVQQGDQESLLSTSLWLITCTICSASFFLSSTYLTNISGEGISSALRLDLFSALQGMPFWFFGVHKQGHFISLFNNQLHGAHNGITKTVPKIITNILTVVMAAYQLMKTDWKVTALLVLILPVFVLLTESLESKMSKSNKQSHELRSQMNNSLKESLSTSAILAQKTFGNEAVVRTTFSTSSRQIQASQEHLAFYSDVYTRVIYVSFAMITSLVYGLWGMSMEGLESVGNIVQLVTAINRLQAPLVALGNVRIELSSTVTSFESIFSAISDAEHYIQAMPRPSNQLKLGAWPGDIHVQDLTFIYPSSTIFQNLSAQLHSPEQSSDVPALKDISVTIKQGSKVAIVGENGSGKSTLAFLLAGLHQPTTGQISAGAHPYDTLEEQSFRKLVGILDQDPWFGNDTLRATLSIASSGATIQDLEHVCRIVNMLDFVTSLPNGFDTVIGENAMRLSSGQRQRLALARLLLKRPSILLLDEFNSHLDSKTERDIFDVLLTHFTDATLIFITHRFSILRRVDHILHLSQCQLIEESSHDDLMTKKGAYYMLYEDYRQSL